MYNLPLRVLPSSISHLFYGLQKMKCFLRPALSLVIVAAMVAAFQSTSTAEEMKTLTVGDVAPALDIEHWVQDNDGKLAPVKEFEKGKVYIVEFWATWCGPCIMSMPHLAETQTKFGYDNVRLISVSDEDLETVNGFLGQTVRGEEEKTYEELTSVYSLTTDPDRSVFSDYMEAAGQNGIPTAFIVGKNGVVEWVGHPMDGMDEALESVVKDSWDREAFAVEFKKGQAAALASMKLRRLMASDKPEDQEEAYKLVVGQLAEMGDSQSYEKSEMESMQIVLLAKMGKGAEAVKMITAKLEAVDTDMNAVMNAIGPIMMLPAEIEGVDKKSLVALGVKKVMAAVEGSEIKDDKLGMVQVKVMIASLYGSANQFDEAVKMLTEARELAVDEPRYLQYVDQMLEQVKAEKEAAEAK